MFKTHTTVSFSRDFDAEVLYESRRPLRKLLYLIPVYQRMPKEDGMRT